MVPVHSRHVCSAVFAPRLFILDVGADAPSRRTGWSAVKTWIKGWITKADVGLPNADNTSDANKPVSTAQKTALGLKLDKTGGTMTGDLTVSNGRGIKTTWLVLDPAQPVNAYDAAHKAYVDRSASIGVGQWYQSGNRYADTVYHNNTGRPITVIISGSKGDVQLQPGDGHWFVVGFVADAAAGSTLTFIVPNGWYYRLVGSKQLWNWQELRS